MKKKKSIPEQEGNTTKKRIAAGFLLLCLFMLFMQACVFAEAPEQDSYEDRICEPYTEKDDTLSTGRVARWSCITFGSYPQTEIVASSFAAVDDYAVQEGDVLEDPDLYNKLVGAEWQDNRTEIGGVRYLRVCRGIRLRATLKARSITAGAGRTNGIISASIPSGGASSAWKAAPPV